MLGRTNLLSVPASESTELVFEQKFIVTSTSKDIIKLENVNNLFFAYSNDDSVMYGEDIENLKYLMKDGVNFKAKHIIFKEGFYYITAIENTKGKAVIYKSADLISYEEITIKTGTSTNVYPVHGIFLKSTGEIVIIFNETTLDTSKYSGTKYLLILNSLVDYNEDDARFIEVTGNTLRIMSYYANSTQMKKDRIYTYTAGSITSSGTVRIVITMDGNSTSYSDGYSYSYFASDYYFRIQSKRLYYSINGIDYNVINYPEMENFTCLALFEYDGCIANIFSYTVDGTKHTKLVYASTPKGLADAYNDAIPVEYEYTFNSGASLYKDDYVYIGSTGGIIIKAKITASDAIAPEVVVLKTLSAKEALSKAKAYTDTKISDYAIITSTLTAGETELVIDDERISENSALSFYTSIYGVNPKTAIASPGSVALTFDVQESDMKVGVRIDGVFV